MQSTGPSVSPPSPGIRQKRGRTSAVMAPQDWTVR
jgi:hypothetical protein